RLALALALHLVVDREPVDLDLRHARPYPAPRLSKRGDPAPTLPVIESARRARSLRKPGGGPRCEAGWAGSTISPDNRNRPKEHLCTNSIPSQGSLAIHMRRPAYAVSPVRLPWRARPFLRPPGPA